MISWHKEVNQKATD